MTYRTQVLPKVSNFVSLKLDLNFNQKVQNLNCPETYIVVSPRINIFLRILNSLQASRIVLHLFPIFSVLWGIVMEIIWLSARGAGLTHCWYKCLRVKKFCNNSILHNFRACALFITENLFVYCKINCLYCCCCCENLDFSQKETAVWTFFNAKSFVYY